MSDVQSKTIGTDRSNIDEYYTFVLNKFKNENRAKLLTSRMLFFLSICGEDRAHRDS
jgi:hypothetical protein